MVICPTIETTPLWAQIEGPLGITVMYKRPFRIYAQGGRWIVGYNIEYMDTRASFILDAQSHV